MLLPLAMAIVLTAAPDRGSALDLPLRLAGGSVVGPPAYRGDAVLLRLVPGASREMVHAGRGGDAAIERTGLGGIDQAAAILGGVRFEPEFLGERAPPPGSGATDFTAFWVAHLAPGIEISRALEAFRSAGEVASAESIAITALEAVPNDSLFGMAWHLYQPSRQDIHAPEAWDVTTGDTSIVVAILDSGVIPYHPDLGESAGSRGQLWINWAERAGIPGVDDDVNGFVDDVGGWDFVDIPTADWARDGEDWRDPDNDPNDIEGHGTAVAGVVGARTNDTIGVSGIAWQVRLMPLRIGWASTRAGPGEVDLSFAARAIRYATRMGASVINCSFSSVWESDFAAALDAAASAGVTVVAAAGNFGSPHYLGDRVDVIDVAATDSRDRVPLFSNRGDYVDLAAPGVLITTTSITRPGPDSLRLRQPDYTVTASGTSFAAPMVSGAVALLQAARRGRGLPPMEPMEAQMRLVETADDITAQNPRIDGFGSGRLNLLRALTDPPTSFVAEARGRTVGPSVVIPTLAGPSRFAVVTADGRLLVINGLSGRTIHEAALPAPPLGGLAAADRGGPRGLGLFVATQGRMFGFDPACRPLPGWPVDAEPSHDPRGAEPALGDLDGDGAPEVLWGGDGGSIEAWKTDGSRVRGFPVRLGGIGAARIALANIDGKPGLEIVAVAAPAGVHVLGGDGTELPGWPASIEANPIVSPAAPVVAYFGDDSAATIIVASGSEISALDAGGVRRWFRTYPGYSFAPPALGDLDGDGRDEIVVPHLNPDGLAVMDSVGRAVTPGNWPLALSGWPIGDPVIGALAGGTIPGVIQFVSAGELVGYQPGWDSARALRKLGQAGFSPSLADLDGDGRTELVAGSGLDDRIFVYDLGPDTWNPALEAWPTARGNFARTGCPRGAPRMGIEDNVPPGAVSDLAATAVGPSEVEVRWRAPSDVGGTGRAARYELHRARFPLTAATFDGAEPVPGLPVPNSPGTPQSTRSTGLQENVTYYFALRSSDAADNLSPISNVASAATRPAPPAPVVDLHVAARTGSTVEIRWTATGDNGTIGRPRRYLVRASEARIDEVSFEVAAIRMELPARAGAGGSESASIGSLAHDRRYWIALEAEDDAGNRSRLSNVVTAGPLVGAGARRPRAWSAAGQIAGGDLLGRA